MDVPKAAKKRRLTDKTVPNVINQNPEFAADSRMYEELLDMERKLDWTLNRKRSEVQDTLARNPTNTRTLRIFMSHTVSGQAWQAGGDIIPNFETMEGIPAWALKIEGRILELSNQRAKEKTPRKFSTLIKKMIVELDRDPALYSDGNISEWPMAPGPNNPILDGFTLRRTGDLPTNIRVLIYLEHFPLQYKVSPALANILGIKEDSRNNIIQGLWNYIKIQGLQDKVDRRIIHADDALRHILEGESARFFDLPNLVNKHITQPDPIMLHYTVDPALVPPEKPLAWDVDIKLEDASLKNRMNAVLQMSASAMSEMTRLDDQIATTAQSLHNSHLKRTFLHSFADDPAEFIQTWLASQSRDLESILGSGPSEGMTVRQEDLKRSDFFRLPWVEEAVATQEGARVSLKV